MCEDVRSSQPNTLHILGSSPSWLRSNIGNQELGSALAVGLWGAAALPVDSRIKSYSLHRNTIIQAEGERLRLRNTDEAGNAGKQTLKETVGGSLPGDLQTCGGRCDQKATLSQDTSVRLSMTFHDFPCLSLLQASISVKEGG